MESVVRRSAMGWRVDEFQSRSGRFAEAASAMSLSLDAGVRTRPIRIDERPSMGRDNALAIPLALARRVPQLTVQATASSELRARG